MSTPSHAISLLVKSISEALSIGLGLTLTADLAEVLAARIAYIAPISERVVLRMLSHTSCAGLPMTPAIIEDRSRNIGQVAWSNLEEAA